MGAAEGKTFSEFDTSDTDDVIALMYVTTPDKTLGGSLFGDISGSSAAASETR